MAVDKINAKVIRCTRCARLVTWREEVAATKTRRFQDWDYWGKPVPGFGDPEACLLVIGLAPAAHGANRTGRMFTGDRSGDWLYRALHKAGFANQARSEHRDDGLTLTDCYITALCRCAPPANKPQPKEFANCADFLSGELAHFLKRWSEKKQRGALVCLGQLSHVHTLRQLEAMGICRFKPRPAFGHNARVEINSRVLLIDSYHPSQQNTFTGKLTEPMLDAVFDSAGQWIGALRR